MSIQKHFLSIAFLLFSQLGITQVVYQSPVWSPSRNEIAFVSNKSGSENIYIYNLNTQLETKITNNDGNNNDPSWSMDGEELLFISDKDGNSDVYKIGRSGDNESRITSTDYFESIPAFIDESKICVSYYDERNSKELLNTSHIYNLLGNYLEPIGSIEYYNLYPKRNASNQNLLLTSKLKLGGFNTIYLYDKANDVMTKVVDIKIASYNGQWSPDGQSIVFINQSDENLNSACVFLHNIESRKTQKIISCEYGCFQPSFSNDGSKIIYRDGWTIGHKGLFVYDLKMGNTTSVFDKNRKK